MADTTKKDDNAVGTTSSGDDAPEKITTGTSKGLFNFQDILKEFYDWEPSKGEDGNDMSGIQMKRTFQGDFIQTVLNNQMAQDLAYINAEVATGQMNTAA